MQTQIVQNENVAQRYNVFILHIIKHI